MGIRPKTKAEQQAMIEGGKILGEILKEISQMVKPGMTAKDIDAFAEKRMKEFNVIPSFKGYHGFPGVTCVSINEEVVHGIPGDRVIKDGDLVKVDCGVIHKKLHTDSALPILVGNVDPKVKHFAETIDKALHKGIEKARAGNSLYEIASAIQSTVEGSGYEIVRELTGHGIGYNLHEEPYVLNYREESLKKIILKTGMTIAIEPIATMGKRNIKTLDDKWTIVTKDASIATQSEHTVLITDEECIILTNRY